MQVEVVCGQPERAPLPGESGCAGSVPGGEERDDGLEQVFGQVGETIGAGHGLAYVVERQKGVKS